MLLLLACSLVHRPATPTDELTALANCASATGHKKGLAPLENETLGAWLTRAQAQDVEECASLRLDANGAAVLSSGEPVTVISQGANLGYNGDTVLFFLLSIPDGTTVPFNIFWSVGGY